MTVEISYWAGVATAGLPMAADPSSSESVAITDSAALSGATPDSQTAISICGTDAFRFEYSRAGATGATATSHYVPQYERLWITPRSGYKFSLRTA